MMNEIVSQFIDGIFQFLPKLVNVHQGLGFLVANHCHVTAFGFYLRAF